MPRFAWAVLVCLSSLSVAGADDFWNQFRGPRGDGTSTESGLPIEFSEDSKGIVWKSPLPGRAWSSPVVWGNQIWVTNAPELHNLAEGETKLDKPIEFSALCFDLETGKILHNQVLFETLKPQFTHLTNSYASPTPFIEEGRVYIHFGAYGTACLDTKTGKKLWERTDLECDHFRGPGSSPVVYGNLLYLTFDGADVQYLIALDKMTGKTVWKRDRGIDYGKDDGDYKKAYSTPMLIHAGGRELLISPFAVATIAYDPQTGEPIWTARHGGMNTSCRPLYHDGLVYVTTGDVPTVLVAIPADGTGDVTDKIVWKSTKAVPKRPSQILVDGLLFSMNDGGVASCVDPKTGEEIWTKRIPGEYWASPICAEGNIYCVSTKGEVVVFKAAREFELVTESKLDDGFLASPAVAGKSLILRSKTQLYRIEKK